MSGAAGHFAVIGVGTVVPVAVNAAVPAVIAFTGVGKDLCFITSMVLLVTI
jgi:hypothetical protein